MKRINSAVKYGTGAALAAFLTAQAYAVDVSADISAEGADITANGTALIGLGLIMMGIMLAYGMTRKGRS